MHFEKQIPFFLNLGFREDGLSLLKAYLDLLWISNKELNLFSRQMSLEELIDNHFIDCLLPLSKIPQNLQKIADLGSGGGLPGVIYAIQFQKTKFCLIEKSPKKRNFLEQCQKLVPNLEIQSEIPKSLRDIDLITARAFKPMDVILELSKEYYESGGKYFLLKGRKEKIDEEVSSSMKKFKNLNAILVPLQSPVLDVERNLVLINKDLAKSNHQEIR